MQLKFNYFFTDINLFKFIIIKDKVKSKQQKNRLYCLKSSVKSFPATTPVKNEARIIKYVNENDFGPKDQEFMVTDPIDEYIKDGGVVKVASANGEYLDGGSVEGWLHANNVVCGDR